MPASAESSRLIRAAPGAVWAAWRDLPSWPRWRPEVVEARWQTGTPWADGSGFALLRHGPWSSLNRLSGAQARRFSGRVLSTADEQLLVWELQPTTGGWLGPTMIESVRLEPAPGGTTVTHSLSAHGPLPALLGPFGLGARMQAQSEQTLEGLLRMLQPPRI